MAGTLILGAFDLALGANGTTSALSADGSEVGRFGVTYLITDRPAGFRISAAPSKSRETPAFPGRCPLRGGPFVVGLNHSR